jgi:hypothetical protein
MNHTRTFEMVYLVIVMGIIVLVVAFSQGWIQIVINSENLKNDRIESKSGIIYNERLAKPLENPRVLSPTFRLIEHRVESGETLFDLENRFRTNWKVIQKNNKIEDPIHLKPGAVIRIPVRVVES